eukprot:6932-Heterococcus_DN1.PRE.1
MSPTSDSRSSLASNCGQHKCTDSIDAAAAAVYKSLIYKGLWLRTILHRFSTSLTDASAS